jgi:hypothetical protein
MKTTRATINVTLLVVLLASSTSHGAAGQTGTAPAGPRPTNASSGTVSEKSPNGFLLDTTTGVVHMDQGVFSIPYSLPDGVTAEPNDRFAIKSPRALAVAAQLLTQVLGVPVSYEDAIWKAGADVTSWTPAIAARLNPSVGLSTRIGAREAMFDFAVPAAAERKYIPAESIVSSVIETYHRAGSPGEFKVIPFGMEEYSIAAEFAGDKDGRKVQQHRPLDERITFPAKKRSVSAAIDEICRTVTKAGGISVLNNVSINFSQVYTDIGADNEVARDVLAKVLRMPPYLKQAWVSNYDPQLNEFILTVYPVRLEITRADGVKRLQDVVWPGESTK